MKKLGKVLLKYVIIAAVVFLFGSILIGYFSGNGWNAPNPKYFGTAFGLTFFAMACLLLYDLLKTLDGKKKDKKAVDIFESCAIIQKSSGTGQQNMGV